MKHAILCIWIHQVTLMRPTFYKDGKALGIMGYNGEADQSIVRKADD